MNRQEFMGRMERELSSLGRSSEEIRDILADFEEHVASGIEGGRSEEDVIAGLGDPKELAAEYADGPEPPFQVRAEAPSGATSQAAPASAPQSQVTAGGVGRGILAALGLLFFDLLIAFPILMSLFAALVSLWTVPIVIGAVGGALVVASFVPVGFLSIPFSGVYVPGLVLAFAGISLLALAVLFAIGMFYPSKWFVRGVKAYAIAHARIVKGGSRS